MPAPVWSANDERSSTVVLMPLRANAMAAVSPPMPPPAITMFLCVFAISLLGRGRAGRRGRDVDAARRLAFALLDCRIVDEKRRAIGKHDLRLMPHVEIDVGMVEGWRRPHALELLDADPDPVDAFVVHEMRHDRLRHGRCVRSRVSGKWRRAKCPRRQSDRWDQTGSIQTV